MRANFKDVTAEDACKLTDKQLESLVDSDDLELESEMQVFKIVQERAAIFKGTRKRTITSLLEVIIYSQLHKSAN